MTNSPMIMAENPCKMHQLLVNSYNKRIRDTALVHPYFGQYSSLDIEDRSLKEQVRLGDVNQLDRLSSVTLFQVFHELSYQGP